MTLQLHAQPYDLAAAGFYFGSYDAFVAKATTLRNDYGERVEEFELQFIDGEDIDCDLAKAIGINQANLKKYLGVVEAWDNEEKTRVILAVRECGYCFEDTTHPDDFDIELYQLDSLRELAEQFVEEGLIGDIPDRLQFYIDFDAIARDLSMDYSETEVAGQRLIYRAG